MINNIYMLFDRVSQAYVGSLMILANDNVAMRSIKNLVNNPQFPMKDLVEDLQFFKLGTIDVVSGKIESEVKFMLNLSDVLDMKGGSNG